MSKNTTKQSTPSPAEEMHLYLKSVPEKYPDRDPLTNPEEVYRLHADKLVMFAKQSSDEANKAPAHSLAKDRYTQEAARTSKRAQACMLIADGASIPVAIARVLSIPEEEVQSALEPAKKQESVISDRERKSKSAAMTANAARQPSSPGSGPVAVVPGATSNTSSDIKSAGESSNKELSSAESLKPEASTSTRVRYFQICGGELDGFVGRELSVTDGGATITLEIPLLRGEWAEETFTRGQLTGTTKARFNEAVERCDAGEKLNPNADIWEEAKGLKRLAPYMSETQLAVEAFAIHTHGADENSDDTPDSDQANIADQEQRARIGELTREEQAAHSVNHYGVYMKGIESKELKFDKNGSYVQLWLVCDPVDGKWHGGFRASLGFREAVKIIQPSLFLPAFGTKDKALREQFKQVRTQLSNWRVSSPRGQLGRMDEVLAKHDEWEHKLFFSARRPKSTKQTAKSKKQLLTAIDAAESIQALTSLLASSELLNSEKDREEVGKAAIAAFMRFDRYTTGEFSALFYPLIIVSQAKLGEPTVRPGLTKHFQPGLGFHSLVLTKAPFEYQGRTLIGTGFSISAGGYSEMAVHELVPLEEWQGEVYARDKWVTLNWNESRMVGAAEIIVDSNGRPWAMRGADHRFRCYKNDYIPEQFEYLSALIPRDSNTVFFDDSVSIRRVEIQTVPVEAENTVPLMEACSHSCGNCANWGPHDVPGRGVCGITDRVTKGFETCDLWLDRAELEEDEQPQTDDGYPGLYEHVKQVEAENKPFSVKGAIPNFEPAIDEGFGSDAFEDLFAQFISTPSRSVTGLYDWRMSHRQELDKLSPEDRETFVQRARKFVIACAHPELRENLPEDRISQLIRDSIWNVDLWSVEELQQQRVAFQYIANSKAQGMVARTDAGTALSKIRWALGQKGISDIPGPEAWKAQEERHKTAAG
jgi:hypothetical protein